MRSITRLTGIPIRWATGHGAHPAHRRALGRSGHLGHVDKFNVEDQVGLFRNSRMSGVGSLTAFCAIGQLPGDEDAALAANLHACKALVKAGNDAAKALRELHGLGNIQLGLAVVAHDRLAFLILQWEPVVVGGVELVSVGGQPAGVENLVYLVGLGHGACADLDLLVLQGEGGLLDGLDRWNSGSGNSYRKLGSSGCRGLGG
jgi:hypothetical protein